MSDIAERLRGWESATYGDAPYELLEEAASEIERLREANASLVGFIMEHGLPLDELVVGEATPTGRKQVRAVEKDQQRASRVRMV